MTTKEAETTNRNPDYFCVECGREQDWGEGNCIKCGSMYLAHIRVYPVFSGKDGAFNAMQLSDDYHMQTAMKRVDEAFEGILYEFARLHRKEREE